MPSLVRCSALLLVSSCAAFLATAGCRGTRRCPEGQVFGEEGDCVPVSTCPQGRDIHTGRCLDAGAGFDARVDASASDGCVASGDEVCNGEDDDCDGTTDEAATCDLPHADATCTAGACAITTCDDDFLDCTDDPGCESSSRARTTCGTCDVSCALDERCASSGCEVPPFAWFVQLEGGRPGIMQVATDDAGQVYALSRPPISETTIQSVTFTPLEGDHEHLLLSLSSTGSLLDAGRLTVVGPPGETRPPVSTVVMDVTGEGGVLLGGHISDEYEEVGFDADAADGDTTTLEPSARCASGTCNGDGFVAYMRDSSTPWMHVLEDTGATALVTDVESDATGQYATGSFCESLHADGTEIASTPSCAVFVLRYGGLADRLLGSPMVFPMDGARWPTIAVEDGRVLMAVGVEGTIEIDGTVYSGEGEFAPIIWAFDYGAPADWVIDPRGGYTYEQLTPSLALSAEGDAFVSLDCESTCSLPDGSTSSGPVVMMRLNREGTLVWSQEFSGITRGSPRFSEDSLHVATSLRGETTFLGERLAPEGHSNGLVLTLEAETGTVAEVFRFGGPGFTRISRPALHPLGDYIIGGSIAGVVSHGDDVYEGPATGHDGYVARITVRAD